MSLLFYLMLALLVLAAVCLPRHGLLTRWRKLQELARRIRREDALKHMLKCEAEGRPASVESIAGALHITTGRATRLLEEMEARDLLSFEGGRLSLRPGGREMGLHVVRAHRLWESYLAERTGVAEDQWHTIAEKQEHLLTPDQIRALAASLGHPLRDPHGDVIPDSAEVLDDGPSRSLNTAETDTPMLIAHLEDEPADVYRQLSAMGLCPGMEVSVIERTPARIRFRAEGKEYALAPVLAENVSVKPLPESRPVVPAEGESLADLRPGERARVAGLSPACRGPERRRLLDLGFVPGTPVEVELVSPAGDPVAYRVRGSVVALRREQARLIRIHSREALSA